MAVITSLQNAMVLWFIHILKTEKLQQLKGMESSKLGNEKGVPFFNRRYTTGVPFLSIMVYKRVRGWTNLVPKAFPLINGWPIF